MRKICLFLFLLLNALCAFGQQEAVDLDTAINTAVWDLVDLLPLDTAIGISDLVAPSKDLSVYLTEHVTALLDRSKIKVVAIDQAEQERIVAELVRQAQTVDEEKLHAFGRQFAVDVIISGYFRNRGDGFFSLVLSSMNVETAEKHTSIPQRVKMDADLARLMEVEYDDGYGWKRKWFFFGARGGYGLAPSWSVELDFQLSSFLAIRAEGGQEGFYYEELARYDTVYDREFYYDRFKSLPTVSALPAITIRPWDFSIEIYGGPYYALHEEAGLGILAGGSLGYKLGPGIIFVDGRYGVWGQNTQRLLSFAVGYKFGFISRGGSR
jgi:hypothetical protein